MAPATLSLKSLRLTIFFGGPSNERNISLDSARTFYDSVRHLLDENLIHLIYISPQLTFHLLDPVWIYSNTIEDFENLDHPVIDKAAFGQLVSQSDVLCPMVHGAFGEDGELTGILASHGRQAIIGSPQAGLALTLDKFATTQQLATHGFPTVPNMLISKEDWEQHGDTLAANVSAQIPKDGEGRWIVKPNNCGSSDGVSLAGYPELEQAMAKVFIHSNQALVEQRILGREFSLILLQDEDGTPVPLLPTEVQLAQQHHAIDAEIYSRSKKYLPGAGATHLTPMACDKTMLMRIREEAKRLFQVLQLEDWSRFDGFLTEDGTIYWSDLNGIPGSGLDSFLFQQAALFGLAHRDVFLLLLARAVSKEGRMLDIPQISHRAGDALRVAVIGGGTSSERHVSRMSWFNVTQKLRSLNSYNIISIFLDQNDQFWEVPAFIALQHTVEEIELMLQEKSHYRHGTAIAASCRGSAFARFGKDVEAVNFAPSLIDLDRIAAENDFAFLALHGGRGEDGRLQAELERLGIAYNGSDAQTSPVCMDKWAANQRCRQLEIPGFLAPHQASFDMATLRQQFAANLPTGTIEQLCDRIRQGHHPWKDRDDHAFSRFVEQVQAWIGELHQRLDSPHAIVLKPRGDGCSSGVMVSKDPLFQVPRYLLFAFARLPQLPYRWLYPEFPDEVAMLQMPPEGMSQLLVEQFLGDEPGSHEFMEMTVGVTGTAGSMQALYPSETLAAGDVLSLDEKFNKGMGINLTPPPSLRAETVASIRDRVSAFANAFGLRNYARIDIMYHRSKDLIYLIEINTLPGLTAATILYTQALVTPEMQRKPGDFLDYLIRNARGER